MEIPGFRPQACKRRAEQPRAATHLAAGILIAFAGANPAEPLALARLGCVHAPGDPDAPVLDLIDGLIATGLRMIEEAAEGHRRPALLPLAAALLVACTPEVEIPAEAG